MDSSSEKEAVDVRTHVKEFLAEKRKMSDMLNNEEFGKADDLSESARTHGYVLDRSIHFKPGMVDNQDGPLSRSVNRLKAVESDHVEERLKSLETHLRVSAPSYPADVYARLKIAMHDFNYTGNESKFHKSGRVSRVPGFYKDLVNIRRRKTKVQKENPLGIDAEASHATEILKTKIEDLKNKVLRS